MELTAAMMSALRAPFPPAAIELKPGATSKDKTKALALAYCDMRAYQERLDDALGPLAWSVEYRPLGSGAVVCRLALAGVVREDVGECATEDANRATIAVAQAFKRTCASFGLGRYLYSLPQVWADWDSDAKSFRNPARVIAHLYKSAGL